ncbi:cAMP-independent regulatory pac2 [Hyphodiscus hymeniophilus]|uniref:cAMP-independent regulatory pac2 n=1 Tax=Hyphodiscus hymeniophilus TaxID=353542 RepID=A0A9P7AV74_9HELO|nr:cAMP-independent regulatory pac2 [Hyphodiscus hymeniophilus]
MDTYYGHVRTPADAIKLFEACRLGLLPRVQRRLSEKERQSIKSGSVFVWDEREAGMRRWTDGKSWSASRVSGSFLTYREMEGKRGGGQFVPPPARRIGGKTPDSGRGSDDDPDMDGEGPDGYRYKPDGLMKQSFSITTSNGQHLHLISYYSRPHPNAPDLPQPTTDPALRHIVPVKGMYPESTVHEAPGPAVTRAPMQQSPYMQSPHHAQMQPGPPAHRGPPPQYPYQVSQGYAWPPSPISTPPFPGHYPQQMYSSALPPPPPGSQHSPYQNHSQHTSPYQQHHQSPHHAPTSISQGHPTGQQTAFDRPPPPLSDSSLPPPPPPPQSRGMSSATAAQQGLMPVYAPNPSPRVAQGQAVAERQAAQMAQRALQSAPMVDPRLTNPVPTSLPPVQVNGTQRASTPPLQSQSNSQNNTPSSAPRPSSPKENGNSQAQSIPSISSLVHATDSVSVMSDNKSNSSRAGSKSPRENGEQRPKDIPHEKLNIIGEDQRAIRVLDRKFVF